MEYDNTNRGVLFANYGKDADGPDYSGKINIEGQDQNLYGYVESDMKVSIKSADGNLVGSIEKVDKEGRSEKYPDWKGSAGGGVGNYGVAGGKRTSKKGNNFLSLSIEKRSEPEQSIAQDGGDSEPLPF